MPTSLHPDTARWFAQRETCKGCLHLRTDGPEMRCAAAFLDLCIDAREPTGTCGEPPRFFVPIPARGAKQESQPST